MSKNKAHYVNNKEFSQAVFDYAVEAHKAKEVLTKIRLINLLEIIKLL